MRSTGGSGASARLAGLARRRRSDAILAIHRNAQRLLRPLAVVNPFADQLTFLGHGPARGAIMKNI